MRGKSHNNAQGRQTIVFDNEGMQLRAIWFGEIPEDTYVPPWLTLVQTSEVRKVLQLADEENISAVIFPLPLGEGAMLAGTELCEMENPPKLVAVGRPSKARKLETLCFDWIFSPKIDFESLGNLLGGALLDVRIDLEEILAIDLQHDRLLDELLTNAANTIGQTYDNCGCAIVLSSQVTGARLTVVSGMDEQLFSAQLCAASVLGKMPIIANNGDQVMTYFGRRITAPNGATQGALCLVSSGSVSMADQDLKCLDAIAKRLGSDIAYRVRERYLVEENRAQQENLLHDSTLDILSRQAFIKFLGIETNRGRRVGEIFSVAVIDIVDLRELNETHGHSVGDAALRHVANLLDDNARRSDVVGRYQGGKLAVLLPTSPQGALIALERFRNRLDKAPLKLSSGAWQIQVRCGVTTIDWTHDDAEAVLRRAAEGARESSRDITVRPAPSKRISSNEQSSDEEYLAPGEILAGNYRILHEISRGGLGVVYRAQDLALSRPVALKLLLPEFAATEGFSEQLRGEAALLASVRHNSLVEVYSYGVDGEFVFFAMELVEGESLQKAIRRKNGGFSIQRIISVLTQIGSALNALHRVGIVHRDVKPENILLDPFRDRAVLIDVGIARRLGVGAQVAGTPGFIAPETFSGQDSPESDVFGLAVTAYHCFADHTPWKSLESRPEAFLPEPNDKPRPISEFCPTLGAADDVFARALDSDPEKRQSSPAKFVEELKDVLKERISAVDIQQTRAASAGDVDPMEQMAGSNTDRVGMTRGIVFRCIPRVLGVRNNREYMSELMTANPRLADALSAKNSSSSWLPAELFFELISTPPSDWKHGDQFATRIGRASLRSSFQRFFPAVAATLSPVRTLAALETIWKQYHTWGSVTAINKAPEHVTVQVDHDHDSQALHDWISGLLEQLVLLSGGEEVQVMHLDDNQKSFDVTWIRAETSSELSLGAALSRISVRESAHASRDTAISKEKPTG